MTLKGVSGPCSYHIGTMRGYEIWSKFYGCFKDHARYDTSNLQFYSPETSGLRPNCLKRRMSQLHLELGNPEKHLTLAFEFPYNKNPYSRGSYGKELKWLESDPSQKIEMLWRKCFPAPLKNPHDRSRLAWGTSHPGGSSTTRLWGLMRQAFFTSRRSPYSWVAVKELGLSYHNNSKAILCTIYPYYGNL